MIEHLQHNLVFDWCGNSPFPMFGELLTNTGVLLTTREGMGHGSAKFNGLTSKLQSNTDIIGTKCVMVSVSIRPCSMGLGGSGTIVSNGQFVARTNNNTISVCSDYGGAQTYITSAASSIYTHTWTHVCIIRKIDGKTSIYINGVLSATVDQNSGNPQAGVNFTIGLSSIATEAFNGFIRRLSIYASTSDFSSLNITKFVQDSYYRFQRLNNLGNVLVVKNPSRKITRECPSSVLSLNVFDARGNVIPNRGSTGNNMTIIYDPNIRTIPRQVDGVNKGVAKRIVGGVTGSYGLISNSPSLEIGAGLTSKRITVETIFKINSYQKGSILFQQQRSASNFDQSYYGFSFDSATGQQPIFWGGATGTYDSSASGSLRTGSWYHLVGVVNDTETKMYLNGCLRSRQTNPVVGVQTGTVPASFSYGVSVFPASASVSASDVDFQTLNISNHALTDEDVKDRYNHMVSLPIFYEDFSETSGDGFTFNLSEWFIPLGTFISKTAISASGPIVQGQKYIQCTSTTGILARKVTAEFGSFEYLYNWAGGVLSTPRSVQNWCSVTNPSAVANNPSRSLGHYNRIVRIDNGSYYNSVGAYSFNGATYDIEPIITTEVNITGFSSSWNQYSLNRYNTPYNASISGTSGLYPFELSFNGNVYSNPSGKTGSYHLGSINYIVFVMRQNDCLGTVKVTPGVLFK